MQGLIVCWLLQVFGAAARPSIVTNFESDFSNGLALYAVLVDHWPALLAKGSKFNKTPVTATHLSENAKTICNMINQLQLSMRLKVTPMLNDIGQV